MSTTVEMKPATVPIFPYVSFTSIEGKDFLLARERVVHCETYSVDGEFDHGRTFINFTSPNHKSKGLLHAVIDMPLEIFRDVLRISYEGNRDTIS